LSGSVRHTDGGNVELIVGESASGVGEKLMMSSGRSSFSSSGAVDVLSGGSCLNTGSVTVGSGASRDGASGSVLLTTGVSDTGSTGDIKISVGTSSERGGQLTMEAGSGKTGSDVLVSSGNGLQGDGGWVTLSTGSSADVAQASGSLSVKTADHEGASGNIILASGSSNVLPSGSIDITTGNTLKVVFLET
jgi:hypothetical protein